MNQATGPDPEERAFRESLRDGIHQMREERGPCPSAEELVAFLEGQLDGGDSARVREHVEACGVCDLALMRVRTALDAPASRETNMWHRVYHLFRNPAMAYGLAALLCYPAYLGVRTRSGSKIESPPKVTPPAAAAAEPAVLSIPSLSLDAVRGTEQLPVIRLHEQDRSFLLLLFVPMKAGGSYSAEVRDGAGRVTVSPQPIAGGDAQGKVALMCRRESFAAGEYTLTVTEESPPGRRFAYVFRVE